MHRSWQRAAYSESAITVVSALENRVRRHDSLACGRVSGHTGCMEQIEQFQTLLNVLKTAQRDLLLACAKTGTLPSTADLRRISDYEASIAALEAMMAEERRR